MTDGLGVSVASAQDNPFVNDQGAGGTQPNGQPNAGQPNTGQPAPVFQQDPQPTPQPVNPQPGPVAQPVAQRGARQATVYLASPIHFTDPANETRYPEGFDLGGGIGIGLRFGWEFGPVVPQLGLGVQTNIRSGGGGRLTSLYIEAGARFQFVNTSRFLPFLSLMVRADRYTLHDERVDPSLTLNGNDFLPGVLAGGGVAVELTRSFGIDASLLVLTTFPTSEEIIDSVQVSLVPRLGGTLYF